MSPKLRRAATQIWREFREANMERKCFETRDKLRISRGRSCAVIWTAVSKNGSRREWARLRTSKNTSNGILISWASLPKFLPFLVPFALPSCEVRLYLPLSESLGFLKRDRRPKEESVEVKATRRSSNTHYRGLN